MEDKLNLISMYEIYKDMLTKNTQDVFEQYYYSDLSLREIGENNNVSFQAVRDTLKKAEKTLNNLESKLGVWNLKKQIEKLKEMVLKPNIDLETIKKQIEKIGE